jgi:hypothetical protein
MTGQVTDRLTSAPIAGATVVFSQPHPSPRVTSEGSGTYSMPGLPPPGGGAYVWAMADGYDPDVHPYRTSSQDFRLHPITMIPAGGSTVVTVRPDDSLCSNDTFGPGWGVDPVCRLVHVRPANGVLTVEAIPVDAGSRPRTEVLVTAGPLVLAVRDGNPVSVDVTGGTEIIVLIAVPPGSPTRAFTLTTSLAP